ncbi:MAG: sacsin N-terminal ATP-binding-like domain-containing protein [Beijerinckiaceae bacterium]
MIGPPSYFKPIRAQAARVWEQLEADPALAGPWHQLFRQVQSPRHVLSELLQNADDAGASEALVALRDGVFVFEHNGEDFQDDHFASLCRFGYSNKRTLHTIGFRGVGFKSTFSLGDTVELHTPTLSVAFDRRRFTEPRWLGAALADKGVTRIQVTIADAARQKEVGKNFGEWLKSPLSLLFFRNIRRLEVNGSAVHWHSLRPGPVPNSEWMTRQGGSDQSYLLARSEAVPFPEDCLAEIRQERLLGADEAATLPPCQVEIVLGASGRLFVVLPTGVETKLPFACNAPFVQDPARLKIKDPETSPTNQWLLKRAGALAAEAMQRWLNAGDREPSERAAAYGFLPNVDRDDNSLEGACGCLVEESFDDALQDQPILLTDDGSLTAKECAVVPSAVLDVWPSPNDASVFDRQKRPLLSRHVGIADRQKLVDWGFVEEIAKSDVIDVLHTNRLPRPKSWAQLLELWAYVAPELQGYFYYRGRDALCIVPVQGQDVLYPAKEVSRLGEKRLLQSEEDWQFLSDHLVVLNPNWTRYLAEQRRAAETEKDTALRGKVDAAYSLLRIIGIEGASEAGKVINQIAGAFFAQKEIALSACIRLAQIAAKLNATAGDAFRFVARDRTRRPATATLLVDHDGTLDAMLPEDWCNTHLLHKSYAAAFTSCSKEEWSRWIASERSGLNTFVPFVEKRGDFWNRSQLDRELRRRDFDGELSIPYVTQRFIINDWDFPDDLWRHWQRLASEDAKIWGRVADRIIAQPETFWSKAATAHVSQVATTGNTRSVTDDSICPSWVLKLRGLPCLKDTRGFYHKPSDLLRRTAETESLIDVEPFVHASLDREGTRDLLDLLAVRDTPTGPERLMDCLRALSKSDHPPLHEVDKWYHRLDQMMDSCSTADLMMTRQAFRNERLILSERGGWVDAASIFLSSSDEDVPDAAIVRPSVRHLALWLKLGVAERPTADLAIQWLKELAQDRVLSAEDSKRIKGLLARYPDRIWYECAHWMNLSGAWVPVGKLRFALSMQALAPWAHLHEWVKQETADLQRLPVDIVEAPPFSNLSPLGAQIEDRLEAVSLFERAGERKEWLTILGQHLSRIVLDDKEETIRVRDLAQHLAETEWRTSTNIEIIPYIGGTPAGTARRADVVWLDHQVLYVKDRPMAKLARNLAQELGRAFRRPDIADAIKLCFERPPDFVAEYLEENFELAPEGTILAVAKKREAPIDGEEHQAPTDDSTPDRGATDDFPSVDETSEAPEDGLTLKEIGEEDVPEPPSPSLRLVKVRSTPPKIPLMERFALGLGFRKDGEDRFSHANGSLITKIPEGSFPWEQRTRSGDLVRCYRAKDHCLEREPLQIESDVWTLIEKFPDRYALVLANPKGEPVELSGVRLRQLSDDGLIKLYPATYRIVFEHEQDAEEETHRSRSSS